MPPIRKKRRQPKRAQELTAAESARPTELETEVTRLRAERDAALWRLRPPDFNPPRKDIFPRGQRDESEGC